MRAFSFLQSSPGTVWTITHNCGFKPVSDVWVDDVGHVEKILPLSVIHLNDNQLEVTFSVARTGGVRIIGLEAYLFPSDNSVDFGAPGQYYDSNGQAIGTVDTGVQSGAPPGPPVTPPAPIDGASVFTLTDSFGSNNGSNDGRSPESVTPGALVWANSGLFNPGGDAGTVGSGKLSMIGNQSAPVIQDLATVFDQGSGMFLEYEYTTDDPNESAILFDFNVGETSIELSVFGTSPSVPTYLQGTIRMNVSGNNGYPGGFPDSYTTDSYYSAPGDYRNKVIRMEVTSNLVKLIVDGTTVIQQVPRFTVMVQGTGASLSAFATYTSAEHLIDYVTVGAL